MEFPSSNIKNFIFSYISGNRNPPKDFLIFHETETLKKLVIFQEMELFSTHQHFLFFRKQAPKNFLFFHQRIFS